jgi:hypothetical protein
VVKVFRMESTQRHVPMSSCTIYAQPTPSGFFGLTRLRQFVSLLDPYAQDETQATIVLDLSLIRVWDISALLWLLVALHHYRHSKGLSFLLRLPDGRPGMARDDMEAFRRSADYLRRWRFDAGLMNIATNVDSILVPEQKGFFAFGGPREFYIERRLSDQEGLMQSLISRRLARIRNVSDPANLGSHAVLADGISECVRQFQAERMGDILESQCGIEKRTADLFSDHLLTEALLNIKDHPHATIGMVGISIMGKSPELVLAVVDNGDSIPETIYQRYRSDHGQAADMPAQFDRKALEHRQLGEIAHYATMPGITRKTGPASEGAGMGLTYIKRDTVDTFRGKLRLITESTLLDYSGSSESRPNVDEWRHSWKGNLLRIAIPLVRNESEAQEQPSGSC